MKIVIPTLASALILASSGAMAAEIEQNKAASFSALGDAKVVSMKIDEMANVYGKHLTITNGDGTWEHPVRAFHGTLTITPRNGAELVIDGWNVR